MNIIPKTIGVINGFNECASLFQWVTSAMSSWKSHRNGSQKEIPHGDVLQLQSDLECLRDTLLAMYKLIDRAEWRSHDNYVADLLSKLKDAVSDAEDLLEEFRYHELKVSVEGNGTLLEPIINFFDSVIHGSFNKVTDIKNRLDNLSGLLEKTGLHQATPRFDKSARPETTSFPTEPKLFGRDEELKDLLRLLGVPSRKRTRNEAKTTTSIPVLPIVGIGGVGKTTLAQNICNHRQVKSHFDKIIWLCVSDDFNVKRLTKEAIEQSSDRAPTNDNLNSLQATLENSVNQKRFLIVLDDMWDDVLKENGQRWNRFCAPFTNVPEGSMMLVTTRSQKVADRVQTKDPFPLEGLKKDIFWAFFKQCVFGSDCSNIDPALEHIGKEILGKLKGSPLAAKTLGRLLGMSRDATHWNNILKSELWELTQVETDILPALRLSYMYLPLHLKRCFSFCAVYPKDHAFETAGLAQIWAAEGLVAPQGNIPLEDIGSLYFKELVNRSFFQKVRSKYVIHDLMHDMAQFVSKDECFIIKDSSDIQKVPKNVRHLSILPNKDLKWSDLLSLNKHKKLRTLFCRRTLSNESETSVLARWCAKFCCMRVVCFAQIRELPESIINMKHLRYIEILKAYRHSMNFPSVRGLYNLNTVYAKKCEFNNIPVGFGTLINLQRFESLRFKFHEALEIQRYQSLSSIEEFLQVAHIRAVKKMVIVDCVILESVPTERFGDFPFLEELKVCNCPKIKSQRLLAPSLKKLDLDNLENLEGFGDFPLLEELKVRNCPKLKSQRLLAPALKKLDLDNLENLEGFGDCPLLEELKVHNCPKLKSQLLLAPALKKLELDNSGNLEDFPSLEELKVCNCPKIKCLLAPSLKKLDLDNLGNLEEFGDFPFLEELKVCNCPKIKSQRLLAPSLKKLELDNSGNLGEDMQCSSLTVYHLSHHHLASIELEKWRLPALQELKISHCESLTSIKGSELISTDVSDGADRSSTGKFPLLTHLTIEYCQLLECVDNQFLYLPAIESIYIKHCDSLPRLQVGHPKWQSEMVLPASLRKLFLWNSGDFSAWFPMCLENVTSLETLVLGLCERIEYVPGHIWTNNLASLQELHIHCCPDLISIGGQEAVANIETVLIEYCSKLKELEQPLRRGDWRRLEMTV